MNEAYKGKTALLSVYHKAGIVEFGRELVELGWNLLASGGTAKALSEAGLSVRDVAELVGGSAILGHKVVTLSRELHAGLLADYVSEQEEMERLGLPFIDLVCVDLYPLDQEASNTERTLASVREKTDIGGPTMLRAAAKGQRIVVCRPDQRAKVLAWLKAGQPEKSAFITELAADAEQYVSDYCGLSARLLLGAAPKD